MATFLYHNDCLTGVFGLTDYTFTCIIEADNELVALEWGNQVATAYNEKYGLLPRDRQLDPKEIPENAGISEVTSEDEVHPSHYLLSCIVGQMPDFQAYRDEKTSWPF